MPMRVDCERCTAAGWKPGSTSGLRDMPPGALPVRPWKRPGELADLVTRAGRRCAATATPAGSETLPGGAPGWSCCVGRLPMWLRMLPGAAAPMPARTAMTGLLKSSKGCSADVELWCDALSQGATSMPPERQQYIWREDAPLPLASAGRPTAAAGAGSAWGMDSGSTGPSGAGAAGWVMGGTTDCRGTCGWM